MIQYNLIQLDHHGQTKVGFGGKGNHSIHSHSMLKKNPFKPNENIGMRNLVIFHCRINSEEGTYEANMKQTRGSPSPRNFTEAT